MLFKLSQYNTEQIIILVSSLKEYSTNFNI